MTLRLILMRHAKSAWDDPGLDDHARTLNGRGRRSAEALGHWLAAQGHIPDAVLSSDSTRTRETWAHMAPAFDAPPTPQWVSDLYLARAQTLLNTLQRAKGQTVLVIAHNPGIAQFAEMILARGLSHPRFRDYPTGATLIAAFDAPNWRAVDWHQGQPVDFTVPRDLGVDPRPEG